ncbi:MAG: translation initiation factor IF-3 [Candidatus Krumholzibacteriia bacterium]|nr:translation initiation factor IF-3 [bacterium]MCB9515093.1 translation initiation factor IF-3 [Candidatus Latescibacterota bacterium]
MRRDSDEPRVNHRIRIPEIRLIDEEGNQVGIIATSVAMEMAQERGLDLVEVSPGSRPPVCRIMDFGKYKYEQSKKAKEARKKQHTVVVKEVQFRPKTDDHDYGFKLRNIIRFLEHKDKVKVTLRFRGREMSHMDFAMQTFQRLMADIAEHGKIEQEPKQEGRTVVMILAPLNEKERRPQRAREEEAASGGVQE